MQHLLCIRLADILACILREGSCFPHEGLLPSLYCSPGPCLLDSLGRPTYCACFVLLVLLLSWAPNFLSVREVWYVMALLFLFSSSSVSSFFKLPHLP